MLRLPFIVLLLVSCSQGEERSCYNGERRPMYFRFIGDEPDIVFLKSCVDLLHRIHECLQDIKSQYSPEMHEYPFNKFAEEYIDCYAKHVLGGDAEWKDLDQKHPELQSSKYLGLSVRVKLHGLDFSPPVEKSVETDIALMKWYFNADSNTQLSTTVENTYDIITKTIVSSEDSWNFGRSVEASGFGASASLAINVKGSDKEETERTATDSFGFKDEITVAAKRTGRLMWTIKTQDQAMNWHATFHVSGWMAVKVQGTIWFLPVVDLAYAFETYMTVIDSNTLAVKATGKTQVSNAFVGDAVIDEYEGDVITETVKVKCEDKLRKDKPFGDNSTTTTTTTTLH